MTGVRYNLRHTRLTVPIMIRYLALPLAIVLTALSSPCAVGAASPQPAILQISWDDLLPDGWIPPPTSIDHFFDTPPPQALKAINVPVVSAMDQRRVRLPGYLVPIDFEGERIRSFLMVPYFGACIHVPPPPPNQVVFVRLDEAISLDDPYGAHWVTGVLSTRNSNTDLAEAAYSMRGEAVETFDWTAPETSTSGETPNR